MPGTPGVPPAGAGIWPGTAGAPSAGAGIRPESGGQVIRPPVVSPFLFSQPRIVWVPGYWVWDGFDWVWVPGYWTAPY